MRIVAASLIGMLAWAVAYGADTQKGGQLENKAQKCLAASSVDFQEELGLSFASLKLLGARIETARDGVDPVGLASAAKELAVMEQVSGKTAKIKSKEVMAEAVDAAQRRNLPNELLAIAAFADEAELKSKLETQAAEAKQAIEARKAGERARGITSTLTVNNNNPVSVAVFVNDTYVGWVNGFSTRTFFVSDAPFDVTKLYARAGSKRWGPRFVPQVSVNHTWNLFP